MHFKNLNINKQILLLWSKILLLFVTLWHYFIVFRFKNLKICLFNYSQMTIYYYSCVYDINVTFMLLMFISYNF